MPDPNPPRLVLGPLLRYVDTTCATVWVETDRPCEVSVLGRTERTWGVAGHHYAIVVVEDLEPGTVTPYDVHLDEVRVWPEPGSPLPESVIRTFRDDTHVRLAFGSCRRAAPFDKRSLRVVGADALVALAERMTGGAHEEWPDALLLVGDQVYADDPSPALKERLRRLHEAADHHSHDDPEAREEIMDFEEYTWLYHESWRTPMVRWLLSSVPTAMILDDHDLRDDWNSSYDWRQEIERKPWWRDRVVGAFSTYWVYQHLGNLSPRELAEDEIYRRMRETAGDDERREILADFAWRADQQPETARWSFYRDFGRTRLVVIDSRCSRRLDPDDRLMVDRTEWAWVREVCDGDVDHLLLGTSVPFLLLHGIHHMEGWNEATARGAWGSAYARVAEKVRRAVDLEHWAAFRQSFEDMVELVRDTSNRPDAPASIMWLSGDVHCSYVAEAAVRGGGPSKVWQLTMSPFRNPLEPKIRVANRLLEGRVVPKVMKFLADRAGVAPHGITWEVPGGPWFDNGVMTVVVEGRHVRVEVDHAKVVHHNQVLERTETRTLV